MTEQSIGVWIAYIFSGAMIFIGVWVTMAMFDLHFHRYRDIRLYGRYRYQKCRKCEKRRILPIYPKQKVVGPGPDSGWLKTGEWTKMGKPPTKPKEDIMSRGPSQGPGSGYTRWP